jgi:hypothetical protein
MAEQSHRDEMNAAIRAQRERHAVPRSLAPPEDPPSEPVGEAELAEAEAPVVEPPLGPAAAAAAAEAAAPKSWRDRLRRH